MSRARGHTTSGSLKNCFRNRADRPQYVFQVSLFLAVPWVEKLSVMLSHFPGLGYDNLHQFWIICSNSDNFNTSAGLENYWAASPWWVIPLSSDWATLLAPHLQIRAHANDGNFLYHCVVELEAHWTELEGDVRVTTCWGLS